jgi:hypothetical protein
MMDIDDLAGLLSSAASVSRCNYSTRAVLERAVMDAEGLWGIVIEVTGVMYGMHTYSYRIRLSRWAEDSSGDDTNKDVGGYIAQDIRYTVGVFVARVDGESTGEIERHLFKRKALRERAFRALFFGDVAEAASQDMAKAIPYGHDSVLSILDYAYGQHRASCMKVAPRRESEARSREVAHGLDRLLAMPHALQTRPAKPKEPPRRPLAVRGAVTKHRVLRKDVSDLVNMFDNICMVSD